MEQVPIPAGATMRYQCGVSGCRVDKTFSIASIFDHLAGHYARIKNSEDHFNYQCKKCGRCFVILGMTTLCHCKQLKGEESDCIEIKREWSRSAAKKNVEFLDFVKQYAVAVFVTKEANGNRSSSGALLERGNRTPIARSPSAYRDGYPLTPRLLSDREGESTTPRNLCSTNESRSRNSVQVTQGNVKKQQSDRRRDGILRSPSTVRSPSWKSRQDALLLENPSPPRTPRRIAQSPGRTSLRSPYGSPCRSPYHSQLDMSGSNHGSRPTTCNTPIKLSTHPYSQIRKGDQCGSRMTPLSAPGPEPFPNKAPWRTYAGYESFCHPFGMYQPYAVPPTTQTARGQFCDTQQSLWHYGTQQTPSATVQRSATPSMDQSPSGSNSAMQLNDMSNIAPPPIPPEHLGRRKSKKSVPPPPPILKKSDAGKQKRAQR